MKRNVPIKYVKPITKLCSLVAIMICMTYIVAAAEINETVQPGEILEFDGESHYETSDAELLEESDHNTYGVLYVNGNVVRTDGKSGIPVYEVMDSTVNFSYHYGETDVESNEDVWHIVEDKSKKLNDKKLEENIMNGVLLLQTSRDGKNWTDGTIICNAFAERKGVQNLHTATDVELLDGCYYRVVAAYKMGIRTKEGSFLGFNTDKYEYKKYSEVYEFYMVSSNNGSVSGNAEQTYSLGEKVRTEQFDGYAGERSINENDPHYGWDLGSFYVSGYTAQTKNSSGDMVFLKNVGDKVTLWFKLNQNINQLNENEELSITADEEGHDLYFETPKMDFGRGTLIIRYADYNNVKAEPEIYTNYLEANTVVGADTKVQLFEEGDYEVALDYEVTSDKLIDKSGHYRIFFKFLVRNGNCMVYPFDKDSGRELTNSAITPNGFRLDLAKSRYLKVNIKREMLKDSADGLVEDTRFNGPAKDGAEYTDEGIYTITVSNEYTGQCTDKKIYVGTNQVMKAYMTTGFSIPEINEMVANGAVIQDDGTICSAESSGPLEPLENPESQESNGQKPVKENNISEPEKTDSEQHGFPVIAVVAAGCCVVLAAILIVGKYRKKTQYRTISDHENGGDEQ